MHIVFVISLDSLYWRVNKVKHECLHAHITLPIRSRGQLDRCTLFKLLLIYSL